MRTEDSINIIKELEEMNAINLLPKPEQFVYKLARYFEKENLTNYGTIYDFEGNSPIETTAKRLYKSIDEIEAIYYNANKMIEELFVN
ncbi:hypothetical protein [Halalkalibacter alkaliphilus]|uniref:Uncharacterized protein n=1 Tax=Halalkalibacter alkaliphilus TaxID=2917993 RepID=A0A9X2CTM8_9BACI|nr:hypothetical protein [Halalkalibacter alkaliphilus]MCL7748033.1 hypothetical protein [Halalkalibacter alkaliphilus]